MNPQQRGEVRANRGDVFGDSASSYLRRRSNDGRSPRRYRATFHRPSGSCYRDSVSELFEKHRALYSNGPIASCEGPVRKQMLLICSLFEARNSQSRVRSACLNGQPGGLFPRETGISRCRAEHRCIRDFRERTATAERRLEAVSAGKKALQGVERGGRILLERHMPEVWQTHQGRMRQVAQVFCRVADWDDAVPLAPEKERRRLDAGKRSGRGSCKMT